MKKKLIAGNWKMNAGGADGMALCAEVCAGHKPQNQAQLLLCPPFTLLRELAQKLANTGIWLGAQDCHSAEGGAHTGDIAATMLCEAGCSHVILGHSERRGDHGESDALVSGKVSAALQAELIPILCIGEALQQRQSGAAEQVVGAQLAASLPEQIDPARLVIAYEPIWAIGTGMTASLDDIAAMHGFLRQELIRHLGAGGAQVPVLYGGSVKPENAAAILAIADVGGALIGGASLKSADFLAIARAAG